MNWLIFSLIPPMVWALTNHIDKYLLEKYFKSTSGIPLGAMSSFFFILVAPVIAFLFPDSIFFNSNSILLFIIGFLSMFAGLFYVLALSKDSPSVVVPLFQIIPVFNYFLGLIFLKEHLSQMQIAGSLLILSGALFLTLEQEGRKFQIKQKVLFLMLGAGLIISLFDLTFKPLALAENYWGATFWNYIGSIFFGFALLASNRTWRNQFWEIIRTKGTGLIGINLANEGLAIIGSLIFNFALLVAPIALVSVVGNGLQPFFVLFFGVILTLLFPHLSHETLSKRHLGQKIIAIAIIFLGTFLLNK